MIKFISLHIDKLGATVFSSTNSFLFFKEDKVGKKWGRISLGVVFGVIALFCGFLVFQIATSPSRYAAEVATAEEPEVKELKVEVLASWHEPGAVPATRYEVVLINEVPCVRWSFGNAGGLACDFTYSPIIAGLR